MKIKNLFMKKGLLFVLILLSVSIQAQNSSRTKKVSESSSSESSQISESTESTDASALLGDQERFYAGIEFGGYPSDADISYINVYGLLSFYYNFTNRFYMSPHFQYKIASTTDYQVLNVNGLNVDMSSFNEYGAGIAFGYKLMPFKKFNITPELKMTYTEYNIQDVGYVDSLNNFISHSFMGMNPRLHADLRISDKTSLGLVGGYILPLYIRGDKTSFYNPQTFTYGLSLKYYLTK